MIKSNKSPLFIMSLLFLINHLAFLTTTHIIPAPPIVRDSLPSSTRFLSTERKTVQPVREYFISGKAQCILQEKQPRWRRAPYTQTSLEVEIFLVRK